MHYFVECACNSKTKDVKKQQVSKKNGSKYEKLSYYENKTFLKKKMGCVSRNIAIFGFKTRRGSDNKTPPPPVFFQVGFLLYEGDLVVTKILSNL